MNPLAGVSEADWQREVLRVAHAHGWRTSHTRRARVGRRMVTPAATGLPDLILVRPPQLVFLELKAHRGEHRPAQIEWLRDLQACDGVEAYMVGPAEAEHVWALLTDPPLAR